MTDTEALLDATVEHAKELLRIGQALVRAHVEGTPPSEVLVVWSVGRRVGTRVSRVTLWRLRTVLGLVSARSSSVVDDAKDLLRIGQLLVRAYIEGGVAFPIWSVGRRAGQRVSRHTLMDLCAELGLVDARGNNQHCARLKPTGRRDTRAAVEGVRP